MTGLGRFSLDAIRDAVRKRVSETSLRVVAEDVGMSFSGLWSFLEGGLPHRSTQAKLARWYLDRHGRPVRKADVNAAIALLAEYVRDAPESAARETRLRAIIDKLRMQGDA